MPREPTLIGITERLREEVTALRFGGNVYHVYNPLAYAWEPHREYLERFARDGHEVLIVGMNPSYFGMVQTGVPFGDVQMVRDWLGIHAPVHRPPLEHPKRPIEGYACRRREVSGQRLWGWARDCFRTPQRFFERFFVLNYCPLAFLTKSGSNFTVDKLPATERKPLFAACDEALAAAAQALHAHYAVGLGRFAERRLRDVLGNTLTCGGAPHPSPANARASREWGAAMNRALAALDVRVPSHLR